MPLAGQRNRSSAHGALKPRGTPTGGAAAPAALFEGSQAPPGWRLINEN